MAKNKKKKEPSQVVVAPLDYERLAKCIAKEIAEENDRRANAFSATREWMKFIMIPIFWLIIALSAVLGVALLVATFNTTTVFQGLISFFLALIFLTIAIMAFLADRDFEKEKDKQFVVSVFSGMISLVALIVALAALLMGVK